VNDTGGERPATEQALTGDAAPGGSPQSLPPIVPYAPHPAKQKKSLNSDRPWLAAIMGCIMTGIAFRCFWPEGDDQPSWLFAIPIAVGLLCGWLEARWMDKHNRSDTQS